MNRRAQKPISIRSDRAAARLALLTRRGRSQAQVVEEALDWMPIPQEEAQSVEAREARILDLLKGIDPARFPSMAEFDAREYDEHGNPR